MAFLALAIAASVSLWHSWQDAQDRVVEQTQTLVKSIDQSVTGMVRNVDYVLQVSSDEISREIAAGHPGEASITRFLALQQARFPNIDLLRATNEQGAAIYGKGVVSAEKVSLAQRDYFKRLRDDPNAGMVIAEPIVGKISQRWIWLMARRINKPDGSFGGLVYGAVFIDELTKTFEQIRMAPGSVIALRDQEMKLVARTTFDSTRPLPIGDTKTSPAFKDAFSLNSLEGTFESGSASPDGISRTYSYRRNAAYGFRILVGIPKEIAIAEWKRHAALIAAFLIIFGIGSLVFLRFVRRARQRQEQYLAQLAESQQHLAQVVEMNPLSMAIVGMNGTIEYVNRKAIETLGYAAEDLTHIDQWWLSAYPDEDYRAAVRAQWNEELGTAIASDKTIKKHEYRVTSKDGTVKTVAIFGAILTNKILVLFDDISAAKRAELELQEARDAAESASAAKSTFLANMSHEIRTPMNAIVGLTHILRRASPRPDQDDKLVKIIAAAAHLLGVINDILDVSKIEAGKLVLEKCDFELEAVVTRICSMLMERVHEKNLELVVDIEPCIGSLNGDPTRLGQALLNYLGNAVKFTERGIITVRARVVEETAADVLVRLEVEDSGIGIAPEALTRLFNAFEQADSSTTRQYGGTGLGLAITHRLARLMGGDAGVYSVISVGSTFWLTARFGRVGTDAGRHRIAALHGRRALVVDDTPVSRLVHSQMLRLVGMECEALASGADTLERIKAADSAGQPFDLVLFDLNMPGMDGIETLAHLHQQALRRTPVAWLVTASGDPAIDDDARTIGFAEVLLKPLSTAAVRDAAQRQLAALLEISEGSVVPEGDNATAGQNAEDLLQRDYRNARILLVEDEPINREVALTVLEDIGLQVDIAEDGRQAVDLATVNYYHLILMDMQMPVMNGLEATRAIRQLPQRQDVPILAMTANAFSEDRVACFDAGMNDFLIKPVLPDNLFEVLLKWLSKNGQSKPVS
jgi:PAS domain S-box-containing protein